MQYLTDNLMKKTKRKIKYEPIKWNLHGRGKSSDFPPLFIVQLALVGSSQLSSEKN